MMDLQDFEHLISVYNITNINQLSQILIFSDIYSDDDFASYVKNRRTLKCMIKNHNNARKWYRE